MVTEPNLHSRNLKFISMLFILHWLLGLTPSDEYIRLVFINYHVANASALVWVAHGLLIYFAWRFLISSKKAITIGYRKVVTSTILSQQNSNLSLILKAMANKNYEDNHRDLFQKQRQNTASISGIKVFDNEKYQVDLTKFEYRNNILYLHYRASYLGQKLPGGDARDYNLIIKINQLIKFKLKSVLCFVITQEDSPDFLLPWLLLLFAIVASVLRECGIKASQLFC